MENTKKEQKIIGWGGNYRTNFQKMKSVEPQNVTYGSKGCEDLKESLKEYSQG